MDDLGPVPSDAETKRNSITPVTSRWGRYKLYIYIRMIVDPYVFYVGCRNIMKYKIIIIHINLDFVLYTHRISIYGGRFPKSWGYPKSSKSLNHSTLYWNPWWRGIPPVLQKPACTWRILIYLYIYVCLVIYKWFIIWKLIYTWMLYIYINRLTHQWLLLGVSI